MLVAAAPPMAERQVIKMKIVDVDGAADDAADDGSVYDDDDDDAGGGESGSTSCFSEAAVQPSAKSQVLFSVQRCLLFS